jgi:hypothetical protein
VFQKYPLIINDLNTKLQNVDVINDTFVFTTSSNFIVDAVTYVENQFKRTTKMPVAIETGVNSVVSNIYQVNNDIFFVHYYVVPDFLKNSNDRPYRLDIYSYNLDTHNTTNYAFVSSNVFTYNASTKLDITSVNLSFNQKQNDFIIVVNLKDTNQAMFIHNILFNAKNDIVIGTDTLLGPSNTNITINFYDSSFVNQLSYESIYSIPSVNTTNGTITF